MHNRVYLVIAEQRFHQGRVGNVADNKLRFRRNSPFESGGESIEDDYILAAIKELTEEGARWSQKFIAPVLSRVAHSIP